MSNPYLESAEQRWLGSSETLKHRVGYKQFTPQRIAWYRTQIFDHWPDNHLFGKSVMEYGCGVGRLLIPLSRQLNGFWYGCDISADMIEEIYKNSDEVLNNIAGLAHVPGDGIPEDFAPGKKFDHIYSVITFQHICSASVVRKILRSFAERLKKDGRFVLQVKKWEPHLRRFDYEPPADGQPEPLVLFHQLPRHLHAEEGNAYTQDQLNFVLQEAGLLATAMWDTPPVDDHGTWLWVSGTKR